MATTDPDAKGGPEPPPNLRVAESEAKECGNCQHYQRGHCDLPVLKNFVLPVNDSWVCDEWAKGGTDADAGETPAHDLKGAERNALIRVREHTRAPAASSQK